MNIPKDPNHAYGILISDKPIVFGYRHADDAIENFSILEGEMADFQKQQASPTSRIRVVPLEEWEQNGFFIVDYKGQKVVIQRFDKTGIALEKQRLQLQAVKDADADTTAGMQEELKTLMSKISDLESKISDNSGAIEVSEKADKAASDKAKSDALIEAGIKSEEAEDIEAIAAAVELEKKAKGKSKPVKIAARQASKKKNAR